jgi:alginate O-acetyltransferase complex protein AlgI
MNAYLPRDPATAWLVAALLAGTLLLGLGISRLRSVGWGRFAAWLLVVGATVGAERLCAAEPPGFRMLAIIGALLYAMKAVVSVEARAGGYPQLSPLRWLAFAALGPGMRPALFTTLGRPALPGAGALIGLGAKRFALGAALVLLARLVWVSAGEASDLGARVTATALLLPGLSLMLHFGVFNVVAGVWRRFGVDARQLFRAPLLSRSLTEFWGRRWNLAFSELTALGVYRPLGECLGRGPATVLAFLASGLLHELAISMPVRAGYGLPLLYFALHGGLMTVEKVLQRRGRPIESFGVWARVWVIGWLALPLPILFHPWFLRGVVWPIIGMSDGL